MTCHDLAETIETMQPGATAQDVARICLLLTNLADEPDRLDEDECLTQSWQELSLKLQAATDQHAAMTEELESLSLSDPSEFRQEHICVLIRAIKVQSQILQMYVGQPVTEV